MAIENLIKGEPDWHLKINENNTKYSNSIGNLETQLSSMPNITISMTNPTLTDGNNGDIWIKYIDVLPLSIDSINITNVSSTGATINAIKSIVPTYWDTDDTNAIITFDLYIDNAITPYANYTWEQISSSVSIIGQSWVIGSNHTVKIKTKSTSETKTNYSYDVISPNFIPLAIPIDIVSTSYNGQVDISWSAVVGATGYNVKRSTTNGSGYVKISTGLTTSNFIDTTVVNGTTYYYVISAVNSNGESENSIQVVGTPHVIQAQWLQWEMADQQAQSTTGYMEINEMEVNSPNILPTTEGNWTASSIFTTGMEASKVADGVLTDNNRWVSASPQNQWIKVNLGSLQTIYNFRTYCGNNASTFPKNVQVYKSILPSPSAKAYGVNNADWILVGTYVWSGTNGWSQYWNFVE